MSIFEINQLFNKLTTSWDNEAAKRLIELFHNLPLSSNKQYVLKRHTSGDSFTGFTQEQGDVNIKEEKPEGKIVKISGVTEEQYRRVGIYKVERLADSKFRSILVFYNFFAADLTTMSITAEHVKWKLFYKNDTLEPYKFLKLTFTHTISGNSWVNVITYSREGELIFEDKSLYPSKDENIFPWWKYLLIKVFGSVVFAGIFTPVLLKIMRLDITMWQFVKFSLISLAIRLGFDGLAFCFRRLRHRIKNKS